MGFDSFCYLRNYIANSTMKTRKTIWFLLIMAVAMISGCSNKATIGTDREIITKEGVELIKDGTEPHTLFVTIVPHTALRISLK